MLSGVHDFSFSESADSDKSAKRQKTMPQEGLASLDKALAIRPAYFDAMEYQNLLLREKAKFEKDETARAELIRRADLMAQRALGLRLKAQEEAGRPRN